MQGAFRRRLAPLAAAAAACALAVALPIAASAQSKTKSVQTEAEWISFDAEARTITVKVTKVGQGKQARKMLKKNKPATFAVKPEGSVLTRTTVSINGKKGELSDPNEGNSVNIYWRPQEDGTMFARKIDVFLSGDELEAKYGVKE